MSEGQAVTTEDLKAIPVPKELPGGPALGEVPKPILVGPQETELETLSLDELFAVKDVRFETFTCGLWPKPVTIGSLSSRLLNELMAERDRMGDGHEERRKMFGYKAIAHSWIQPDGKRIPEDKIGVVAELFREKDSKHVDALAERVMELNGVNVKNDLIKNVSSEMTLDASRSKWRHTSGR